MPSKAVRSGEELRRRLLRDMGIEFWYARGSARVPVSTGAGDAAEDAAAGIGKAGGERADDGVPGPSGGDRSETASVPSEPGAQGSGAEVEAERRDDAAFAVVAYGLPGALLVAEASRRREEAVLARDVLRAARRDWSAAVGQARFEWPQPGVSGEPGPALAAFVEKQAEDFRARLVLVTESVAGRLGDCPVEPVTVPAPSSLAEPRSKAALWRRLQQLTP